VGDISLAQQVRLPRLIENGVPPLRADVRLVAATHRERAGPQLVGAGTHAERRD
jgi:transcriptional regulator of acetoin/glycerol metabolism